MSGLAMSGGPKGEKHCFTILFSNSAYILILLPDLLEEIFYSKL